jgi:hypothetical protein
MEKIEPDWLRLSSRYARPGKTFRIAKVPMIISRNIRAIVKPDGSRNSILINEAFIVFIERR